MKTILLVDDEPSIVESLAELLDFEGFRVLTATNGRDGLTVFEAEPLDLLLVDYMMPVMDGASMLRAMWSDPGRQPPPAIVLTAAPRALPEDVRGRVRVLQKPFEIDALLREVHAQLGQGS